MSLVDAPLARAQIDTPHSSAARGTVRAMEIGQHCMAVLLTVVGAVRAIHGGTSPTAVIIAALAILAWHTLGALLPTRARSHRLIAGWLLGFAGVWIAAVTVSAEFIWLAFLLWLLAGHLLSVRSGVVFSALVLVVVVIAPILHHGTTSYANVFGPLIGGVFAYGISRGYLQLLRDADERERLVNSLTDAQREAAELEVELALSQRHSGAIAERTRISRDIHDTIAQSLSSIRLLAHAEANRASDPVSRSTLLQVETIAGQSLSDVRRIVAELLPAELEDDALAAALKRLLDRAREETGMPHELHVADSLPILSTEVEVALLRTAQSALANVRLHSGATRVVMSLIDAGDSVRLDFADDGEGFDVAAWERAAGSSSSNFGLRFMRDRMRELGGGLEIESTPGQGTAISAHLPIHLKGDKS